MLIVLDLCAITKTFFFKSLRMYFQCIKTSILADIYDKIKFTLHTDFLLCVDSFFLNVASEKVTKLNGNKVSIKEKFSPS